MLGSRLISARIPLTWSELLRGALAVAALGLLLTIGILRWQAPRLRALACPPSVATR